MKDINDCDFKLINAWNYAVPKFRVLYPNLTPKIVCSIRSPQDQDKLFKVGRTVVGANPSPSLPMGRKVTNAKGYESPHNYDPAQAFDFFFVDEHGKAVWNPLSLFQEFSELCLEFDHTLVYGGSFSGLVDNDHIETGDWKKLMPVSV